MIVLTPFLVSEYFSSLQGEGNAIGKRAFFLRFQICNLHCTWCDTKYALSPEKKNYSIIPEEELLTLIGTSGHTDIIFTGGEPLLQPFERLMQPNLKYHVETSGTLLPSKTLNLEINGSHFI